MLVMKPRPVITTRFLIAIELGPGKTRHHAHDRGRNKHEIFATTTRTRFRHGIHRAQDISVAALVFLFMGLICALIGRFLLLGAAFGISVWWGLGVFLPFGPLLFRLSYPDLAPLSKKFRLATLPCILLYFILRTGGLSGLHQRLFFHLT